jgi:hypothetical protein
MCTSAAASCLDVTENCRRDELAQRQVQQRRLCACGSGCASVPFCFLQHWHLSLFPDVACWLLSARRSQHSRLSQGTKLTAVRRHVLPGGVLETGGGAQGLAGLTQHICARDAISCHAYEQHKPEHIVMYLHVTCVQGHGAIGWAGQVA